MCISTTKNLYNLAQYVHMDNKYVHIYIYIYIFVKWLKTCTKKTKKKTSPYANEDSHIDLKPNLSFICLLWEKWDFIWKNMWGGVGNS